MSISGPSWVESQERGGRMICAECSFCGGRRGYDWKAKWNGRTSHQSKIYCFDCGLPETPWIMRGNNVTAAFAAIIAAAFLALFLNWLAN